MYFKRAAYSCLALLFVFAIMPSTLHSQSPTTGAVTGTVTDASGAVILGASVTLTEAATGATLTGVSDSAGHFVFPVVAPGNYTLKATAKGFRTTVVTNLKVVVSKSGTVDMTLQVGEMAQVVEVRASSMTELQTSNATVGEVLSGDELARMPVMGTSAAMLIFIQPAVSPGDAMSQMGGGDTSGGAIAGARSEQVTFYLDGGDATSDLEGSNSYVSPDQESGAISPVIPVPLDAIQEFRVATNNAGSGLTRSSGGQIAFLTKSGTNTLHGSAFEYYAGDALDANGWTRNSLGIRKPHIVDNRFGASAGGPIIKDKLFIYGFYEGRRFQESALVSRVVPTSTLKQGILRFKDDSGNIVSYNLNTANGALSSACGSLGTSACDPRGIGFSPVIKSQFALYPAGNNSALGDGLNTTGVRANVPTPIRTDLGKLKLSYNLNSKWSAFATWHYSKTTRTGTEQINILGTPKPASGNPYYANFYTFQVQGQLTPHLTAVTHGSYLRNWWAWVRTDPSPLVSGTNAALQIGGEGVGSSNSTGKLLADPVNINTQQARSRIWNGHDWYIAEDMTWVHGKHTFQFGGSGTIWHDFHLRTDDVLGGLTSAPIYNIGSRNQSNNTNVNISSSFRPPTCSTTLTTNCISSGLETRWNGLYAAVLGMVDHSNQILTRDGNFNPNPLGTALFDKVSIPSFQTYFQDVWKIRPSLTVTLGLNWGAQLAPSEEKGKEVVLTYADTSTPVNFKEYFQNRVNALGKGQAGCFQFTTPAPPAGAPCFNPSFGLIPVNKLSAPFTGKMRVTDWTDLGPSVGVAWQVPFKNWLFGNNQTVIRGGYAKVFDRNSAVNQVLTSLLAGGLADVTGCFGPTTTTPGGGPGALAGCSNARTSPTDAFRIGVDGSSVPVPAPTAQPIPFIPSGTQGNPFGLFLSAPLDPHVTPGYAHSIDFTVQRALPHNLFFEVGYIGRFSRNLPQAQAIGVPYYLMKDPSSGQTYAQAFDAVAKQLRAGVKPLAVTPQPFFEHLIGPVAQIVSGGVVNACTPTALTPATNFAACDDAGDLINGDFNSFGTFEVNFDTPQPIDNLQVFESSGVTSQGYSSYNAGFVVVRKAFSHGLQFQFDWTWSHAIGNQGLNQQYIYSSNSPYNVNIDRSSELFDHKHVFHFLAYYDLPFGKGHRFSSSNGIVDRIIGGWTTSTILTYYTGTPACVQADGNYGSFLSDGTCSIPSGSLPSLSSHSGVKGSGGIGTNSDPANGGSGLNMFGDPAAVFNSLSRPLLSVQGRVPFDQLRAVPYWNLDFGVTKNVAATERFKFVLVAGAFNLFNHVIFATPSLDLGNKANFGVITDQGNGARRLQLGLKFEF